MLDQLSNYPSPSPIEAKGMMYQEITSSSKYTYGKYRKISKKFIRESISKIIDEMQPFGSEAAWHVCHHPDIINSTNALVELRYNKIKQYWKKLKIYVKVGSKLIKIWRENLEKMYHPDSLFVRDCCDKYENIFSIKPPPPPDNIKDNLLDK